MKRSRPISPHAVQIEIVTNFFVGYYEKGRYIDDPARVAWAYISSFWGFWSALFPIRIQLAILLWPAE